MTEIETLREIADAAERAKRASTLAARAQAKADAARPLRDEAALVLHRRFHRKSVEVYRAIGVSRSRFVGMVNKAPRKLPKMTKVEAEDQMLRNTAIVQRNDQLADEARQIRDEAAEGMMNGRYRKDDKSTYRNADVARLTGLTTARVAQVRQGTR